MKIHYILKGSEKKKKKKQRQWPGDLEEGK